MLYPIKHLQYVGLQFLHILLGITLLWYNMLQHIISYPLSIRYLSVIRYPLSEPQLSEHQKFSLKFFLQTSSWETNWNIRCLLKLLPNIKVIFNIFSKTITSLLINIVVYKSLLSLLLLQIVVEVYKKLLP